MLRAREGLSGTEKRLEDLEQELSLSLAKTGFPSRAAVASALRTQEERERLRKELEDFKQEGKLPLPGGKEASRGNHKPSF